MKRNCWDIKKCGKGPKSGVETDIGNCPVVRECTEGDPSSGRSCWKVRIKDDRGRLVPNWSRDDKDCLNCDVMDTLRKEDGELSF